MENTPDRYKHVSKVARKYLRNYITSIFLIKGAERKIKEMEIQVKKSIDLISKRPPPAEEMLEAYEQVPLYSPVKRRAQ
jgi:hypothetical protein